MACTITIDGTKYTEKQFKNLLKSGLLYNSMERGLVTLPVEVGVIAKPETEQTKFRRNFPFKKEDVVLAMINVFGLDNKQARAAAEIADRMATAWAARNNKTKEDFYKTLVYIKPASSELDVTDNLLFAGLDEFNFTLTDEVGERKNYNVSKDGVNVGKLEIDINENGEYYVSYFARKVAGAPGDGVKMFRAIMENLMAQGLPVAIDTSITPSGFAAMEKLAKQGFLIKVGEEIKSVSAPTKPMDYKTPPFIVNPKVIPKVADKNTKFLFQETLKDSTYTPTEVTQLSKEKEAAKEAAIKNGTFLKAPNGKDTNLTEDQWLTVQTPTFKNWFGDSKVLDDNGEPKVMYHGTNNEFSEFSEEKRKGLAQYNGIFVSPEIFFAEDYSTIKTGRILELFAKASNPFDYDNPAHVKLATEAGLSMTEVADPTKDSNWAILERGTFQKFIQENNFDGYYTKEDGVKNIAVYKSNQLKVSDGRNQTFLESSKNIFYQQGASQVIASVVKGFNLEQNPKGFGLAFNTKNQKASPELASRINTWMAQNNLSGVKFYYEKLYGTINAIVQPQSNLLFQIIGEKGAKNLRKLRGNKIIFDLEEARDLVATTTLSNDEVFKRTGWQVSNAGKFISELDYKFKLKGVPQQILNKIKKSGPLSLSEILDYPELYAAYPELSDLQVYYSDIDNENGNIASFTTEYIENPGFNFKYDDRVFLKQSSIILSESAGKSSLSGITNATTLMSVFAHEIQHAIQVIEGFPTGTNLEEQKNGKYRDTYNSIIEQASKIKNGRSLDEMDEFDKGEYLFLQDKANKVLEKGYKENAGEIQASAVQARLLMNEQERKDKSIKNTESNLLFQEKNNTDITKTKEFKFWFGDWHLKNKDNSSKVVNADGTPKVVYHWSPSDSIEIFNDGLFGIHFGTEKAALDRKSDVNTYFTDNFKLKKYKKTDPNYKKGKVYPVYLNLKNPLRIDDSKYSGEGDLDAINYVLERATGKSIYKYKPFKDYVKVYEAFEKKAFNLRESDEWGSLDELYKSDEYKKVIEQQSLAIESFINSFGYDGIVYTNAVEDAGSESYIVFDKTKIKSATSNSGEFDTNNPNIYNQQAQAAILIGQEVADIIYALQNPNVSSPVHELAHKWEKELTEEERNQVLDFAKENNVDITNGWTREVSEAFARGFEKYLAEGIAPTPALERIFKQFAEWLTTIYKGIVGSEIDINLNDDMRKIYATMLGENFETTIKEEVAAEQAAPVVEAAAPVEENTQDINTLFENLIKPSGLLGQEGTTAYNNGKNLIDNIYNTSLEAKQELINIINDFYEGRTRAEVAAKYNMDPSQVQQIRIYLGIPSRTTPSTSLGIQFGDEQELANADNLFKTWKDYIDLARGGQSTIKEVIETVPDAVDWKSPITESTQDIEAKKQAIQLAYDNKSFDAALESGALSLEEVERIIVSAGLPIKMVDNIMFRMNNPEATYTVKGLLSMKVNEIFQQVATYFLETGLLYEAIMRTTNNIESGLAKELLDKITPDENSPSYVKFRNKVIELYNNNLAELERIKQEDLFKKNGFKVGDAVLFQGTKFIIIDEQIDGNKRFVGFMLKNALNTKAGSVEDVRQISEWTEELEKEFVVNNKIKELKEELGLNYTKPVNTVSVKQDVNSLNLKYPTFDDVKNKGVSAQSYSQILLMSRKFAAMFPFMNIEIGYLDNDTKGHVYGNTIIINLKNATKDTPIHELLHPFMFVLKKENPKLYAGLLGEFRNNSNVYNVWMEDVKANSFYSKQLENIQEEEAFIQYLGELIADMHDDKGNFIKVEVFIRLKNNAPKKKKEVDLDVEDDFDVTDYAVEDAKLEQLLENATIAEIEQTIFEEDSTDGKTQKDYEALGYVVVGEVESSKGVEGRTFKSIKMVHPKMQKITSTFKEKFYNWFRDLLKKLIGVDKGGARKVKFSEWNLAEYDPTLGVVSFFKPAENRAERLEKVQKLDSEGNVISTKKVRVQRRDDKPSYTVSVDKVEDELRERGASELEISDFMYQVNGHQFESFILKMNLEDSYVPSLDNLQENIKNKDTAFFSGTRRAIDFKDLPTDLSINDLASMFSMAGPGIKFDLEPHQDALTKLEAYQYTNSDIAKDLIDRTEKRVKILTATDARIGIESSPTVKSESFAVKELLNKYKDVEFIEAYVRQGISALSDAAKMIKYIKEAIKDGEAIDEVMNQTLNRDLREAQALMAFYDDVASLIEKNEKMFEQEDLDYFNSIMTRATSRRKEINSILVDLITEWLFPTIAGSQKNVDTKEALTKEEFKKNVRAATSDVNLVSYFGQAPVNSRDPLMAALAIKVKDELNKNYREEENSLQRLRVLYDDFLKATGIANTTKAVEEYYKANFLRKAKVWELVAIEKGGVKKYDYVERWAFHEEYLADVHAEARRQEIERLKKQLGEPNNYDERLIFNERLTAWDNANPLQSERFRNPAFSNLKSNEYYMFLYDMYKKANDKYADRRLDFGIIPQAYNSPNALEKAKKTAQYTSEVLKGDKKAASKLKELGVSAANSIFDKNSFEKVQALNLDGSYHMSVKSPFTHLLDEQFLSFRLNESVYGFSTSANAYNTLRSNQANVENLKLLINGNTKLGIQARKVLKSKIKTRDGITSSEMVWDVLEGMPPQDKEQSAKLITKQMNAYINDTFYGVSEIGGEFNIGPVVINVNKIADNLGFFTALLNMAGNLIAGVSNITVGNAMSLGEAFGGKFYTPKDWVAAQGIYFKEFLSGKFMADAIDPVKSKITQLGIMHDAIQGEFRDKYGKNITGNVLQRYFTKDTLFIINHIAEHQIQLTGMLALMNSTKVKLKDGSEVNLYDAYVKNDKGFYKLRPDAIWSEKQQQEFIRTLHGVSRDLNGNYAAYDKAMIQRYALGKLALQYRKYLYTAWRGRFGSKRYDYEKGTTQEGYYRAFLKALYADIKEFNLNSLTRTLLDPRVSDRKLTDEQKYAIRKTRYDIVMIVGLTMLSTMLATAEAGDDDDDLVGSALEKQFLKDYNPNNEDKYWIQLLLLVSLRLRSDLSSYSITAPQELHKILTNPSASFNTITKFTEFLGQLTNDVQNGQFETYERRTGNNEAGDLKVVGKFEKLLPVYRQWLRLQNPEDQLKYYDLINKNVTPSN